MDPMPEEKDFLIIGHRGSVGKKIENTIESFEEALHRDQANALEMDLCLTKDGEVILWHDWDPNDKVALARQAGLEKYNKYRPYPPLLPFLRRPTCELDLETIKDHYSFVEKAVEKEESFKIPTFEEFVRWARGQEKLAYVFLDMKIPAKNLDLVPAMMGKISRVLDASAPKFKAVFLTPEKSILEEIKKYAPQKEKDCSLDVEIPPTLGIGIVGADHLSRQFSAVKKAIDQQNHYASIGRSPFMYFVALDNPDDFLYDSSEIYQKIIMYDVKLMDQHNASAVGIPVEKLIGWTINEAEEMERLIRMGMQGIVSDRPNLLFQVAAALGKI
jgi:glycerophosphoryl diester phosphodiesterase